MKLQTRSKTLREELPKYKNKKENHWHVFLMPTKHLGLHIVVVKDVIVVILMAKLPYYHLLLKEILLNNILCNGVKGLIEILFC